MNKCIDKNIIIIPISIFYFNQFPGLFFISNLIIIPVLVLILCFGILVILLAIINILPDFIAVLFGKNISLMNSVVGWVSNQEAFLIKDISLVGNHNKLLLYRTAFNRTKKDSLWSFSLSDRTMLSSITLNIARFVSFPEHHIIDI